MNLDGKMGSRLIWTTVALVACLLQIRSFIGNLRPVANAQPDFFQEWASARNHLEGLPIYTHQTITLHRYSQSLHQKIAADQEADVEYNGHPPSSVLLALPLARLDFSDAVFAWSLVSLLALSVSVCLILRQFPGVLTLWSILPLAALLLWCNGFRQQMIQVQLNLVLLLLFTATWVADRAERPWWAGVLLGVATAIKLFPGFLFLYFVMRRQWRPLLAGAVSFLTLTALTVGVLGPECYRDYVTVVLPSLEKYRVLWLNLSLMGFWHKLFNSAGSQVIPLWQNPPLAWAATLISDGVVTALAAWFVWHSRSLRDRDLAFALTTIAMLLVSPITWDHYFTLLFLPLFLLWVWLPAAGLSRVAFWLLIPLLWLQPLVFWMLSIRGVRLANWRTLIATPRQAVTVLSIQTYILLALFIFTIVVLSSDHRVFGEGERTPMPS